MCVVLFAVFVSCWSDVCFGDVFFFSSLLSAKFIVSFGLVVGAVHTNRVMSQSVLDITIIDGYGKIY